MRETFTWWLALELLGIVGLPLAAVLFANLPDRGWAFAKPLSLLVVGWLVWFPLSIVTALPFSRVWIVGTFLAFAAVNLWLARLPGVRASLRHLLMRSRGYILTAEALFAGAFALMGWERSFTPGAVDTEKFMDLAFLSAIWRAPHLPPPDPWLSGQPINYYYFGHYLLALVAKALDTPPAFAFNLGIALIFALAAVAIFGVAANIVAAARRGGSLRWAWLAGLLSVALVLVLGNLNGAQVWWREATLAASAPHAIITNPWGWWLHRDLWPQYNWWFPSRVIPNTINEFPAFSFVLADLHAHVLALPFVTLAVALALNLLLAGGRGPRAFGDRAAGLVALGVSAMVLGSLYAINGWDLPTYLGLAVLALGIQQWLTHERHWNATTLLDLAAAVAPLVILSFLLYLPFYRGFTSPSQGIGLVPFSVRSPIGDEIAIFGLPAFILLSFLAVRLARWAGHTSAGDASSASGAPPSGAQWRVVLLVGAGAGALLTLTRLTRGFAGWTTLWGSLIVLACAALALRHLGALAPHALAGDTASPPAVEGPRWRDRAEIFVYCLAGTAAALLVTCELIYLRDIFGGGASFRLNTVFKLYFQVWLLAGLASGPALMWLASAARAALAHVWAPTVATTMAATGTVSGRAVARAASQGELAASGVQRRA
ncbi:MAG: hypothetical protein IVW57_10970, partial [Ktedonobacterales bacterium]|nr:hypothetical protein [Ktedonobacterales bacterium]